MPKKIDVDDVEFPSKSPVDSEEKFDQAASLPPDNWEELLHPKEEVNVMPIDYPNVLIHSPRRLWPIGAIELRFKVDTALPTEEQTDRVMEFVAWAQDIFGELAEEYADVIQEYGDRRDPAGAATQAQLRKLDELDIEYDEDITLSDASALIEKAVSGSDRRKKTTSSRSSRSSGRRTSKRKSSRRSSGRNRDSFREASEKQIDYLERLCEDNDLDYEAAVGDYLDDKGRLSSEEASKAIQALLE